MAFLHLNSHHFAKCLSLSFTFRSCYLCVRLRALRINDGECIHALFWMMMKPCHCVYMFVVCWVYVDAWLHNKKRVPSHTHVCAWVWGRLFSRGPQNVNLSLSLLPPRSPAHQKSMDHSSSFSSWWWNRLGLRKEILGAAMPFGCQRPLCVWVNVYLRL